MIRIGPRRVKASPAGARNRKKHLKLIFKNPRSSILPESAPDPIFSAHNNNVLKLNYVVNLGFEKK